MSASGPNEPTPAELELAAKKARMVNAAKSEIIATEESFNASLSQLRTRAGGVTDGGVSGLLRDFEQSKAEEWVSGSDKKALKELNKLLEIIRAIEVSSQALVAELRENAGPGYSEAVMNAYKANLELLAQYGPLYVQFNKMPISGSTLKFINDYLNQNLRQDEGITSLQQYIMQPVQRIMRYPMTFSEIVKNLPSDSPERANTQAFIDLASEKSREVNELVKSWESLQNLQNLKTPAEWRTFFNTAEHMVSKGLQVDVGEIQHKLLEQVAYAEKTQSKTRFGRKTPTEEAQKAMNFLQAYNSELKAKFSNLSKAVVDAAVVGRTASSPQVAPRSRAASSSQVASSSQAVPPPLPSRPSSAPASSSPASWGAAPSSPVADWGDAPPTPPRSTGSPHHREDASLDRSSDDELTGEPSPPSSPRQPDKQGQLQKLQAMKNPKGLKDVATAHRAPVVGWTKSKRTPPPSLSDKPTQGIQIGNKNDTPPTPRKLK